MAGRSNRTRSPGAPTRTPPISPATASTRPRWRRRSRHRIRRPTARQVAEHAGTAIDQAYIGACVGAKLDDLTMAADILRGRRVAPNVRLLVAPASARVTREATASGVLGTLLDAGAILLPSGLRRLRRDGGGAAGGGRDLHLHHQPQLQGPDGRFRRLRLSGQPLFGLPPRRSPAISSTRGRMLA